jgi:lysophospholipase L1-like esterase
MSRPVLLFIGDSITDCNRDRLRVDGLGQGYVAKVAKALPEFTVYNRGISGNRVVDLRARWTEDALALHPDILVVLIGVNEVWHQLKFGSPYTEAQYEADYREILTLAKAANPNLKIVLMQPFIFEVGEVDGAWPLPLNRLKHLVERLAAELADAYIPLQTILSDAAQTHGEAALLPDGVHPSDQGHAVIANAVLNTLKTL